MRKIKKPVSVLATLVLLAMMMLPVAAPAFAGTTNVTSSIPNIVQPYTGHLTTIKINGLSIGYPDQIQVVLPSGMNFVYGTFSGANGSTVTQSVYGKLYDVTRSTIGSGSYVQEQGWGNVLWAPDYIPDSNNVPNGVHVASIDVMQPKLFSFTVVPNGNGNGGYVRIDLPISVTSAASGPIKVQLFDTDTAVTAGEVTIGNVVTGGTITTINTTAAMAQNSSDTYSFLINENSAGALGQGGGEIHVDLPSHFTWSDTSLTLSGGFQGYSVGSDTNDDIYYDVTVNGSGNSRLVIKVNRQSQGMPGTILVNGSILADYNAPQGDIIASFGGTDAGFTATTATIGTCGDYNVTATTSSAPTIFDGQTGQDVGTFTVAESVKNTLIDGRSLSITLPGGVRWTAGDLPVPVVDTGSVSLSDPTLSSDGQTVTYQIHNSGGSASTIEFRQGEVDVDATVAPGDLVATISGSGINQTATIAKIASPVSATAASTPQVVIGQGNQAASDFTITEAAAGAIAANQDGNTVKGYLDIIAPSGVTFAGIPTIKVTSGDLNLSPSGATLTDYNGKLDSRISIPISNGSTKASTISVSNLKLNIDNTVGVGPVSLVLGGTALVDPHVNGSYVTSVPVATCITPITKTTGGTAVFKIGSTDYTVNGQSETMDVAPYTQDGRTYVPVRYAAEALGVTPDNILYQNGVVTIIKGSTVVQMTLGSKVMKINGASVSMDVPATTTNGRTVLPLRWLGTALGATFNWDEASQTVTVNIQ